MKHIHAKWIKQWVDGVVVENRFIGGVWHAVTELSNFGKPFSEFRVKPEVKPEPVYEYEWLIKYLDGELVITGFHKTEEEVWNNYGNGIAYVERLDKYKREVKE